MAQTIQLKRSNVTGKKPLATDLAAGEVAINTADARMFIKNDADEIVDIGFSGLTLKNGYWGLTTGEGADDDWIRTTVNGILPFSSGGASSLGTSSWRFNSAHIVTVNTKKIITDANQYAGVGGFGINLRNSDIIGINSLVFADVSQNAVEGLVFPKTSITIDLNDETTFDSLRGSGNGDLVWRVAGDDQAVVTLGGPTGNRFIYGNSEQGTISVNEADGGWDSINKSGFYDGSNITNAPSDTGWYWGIHSSHINANGYGWQLVSSNGTEPSWYLRGKASGNYGAWHRVLHEDINPTLTGKWNFSDRIRLDNSVPISALKGDGTTEANILWPQADNDLVVGYNNNWNLKLHSASVPTWYDNTQIVELLHGGGGQKVEGSLTFESSSPFLYQKDTDAGVDSGIWAFGPATSGTTASWRIQARNDAGAGGGALVDFLRSGNNITNMIGTWSGSTVIDLDFANKKIIIDGDEALHTGGGQVIRSNSTAALGFEPLSAGGQVGIKFESKTNPSSDGGYIIWKDEDEVYGKPTLDTSGENATLLISVRNDHATHASADALALESTGDIFLCAGAPAGATPGIDGAWSTVRGRVLIGNSANYEEVIHTGGNQSLTGTFGVQDKLTITGWQPEIRIVDTDLTDNVLRWVVNTDGNLVLQLLTDDGTWIRNLHDIESSSAQHSFNRLRLGSTGDVGLSSTQHAFQIGDSAAANIAIDTNEVQARNNGSSASLYLNNSGGGTYVGAALHVTGHIHASNEIKVGAGKGLTMDGFGYIARVSNGGTIAWLGNASNPTEIVSSIVPRWNDGTTQVDLLHTNGGQRINNNIQINGLLYWEDSKNIADFAKTFNVDSYWDAGEMFELATITPSGGSRNYFIRGELVYGISDDFNVVAFDFNVRSNTLPSVEHKLRYSEVKRDHSGNVELVVWEDDVSGSVKLLVRYLSGPSIHNIHMRVTQYLRGNYEGDIDYSVTEEVIDAIPVDSVEYSGAYWNFNVSGDVVLDNNDTSAIVGTDSTGAKREIIRVSSGDDTVVGNTGLGRAVVAGQFPPAWDRGDREFDLVTTNGGNLITGSMWISSDLSIIQGGNLQITSQNPGDENHFYFRDHDGSVRGSLVYKDSDATFNIRLNSAWEDGNSTIGELKFSGSSLSFNGYDLVSTSGGQSVPSLTIEALTIPAGGAIKSGHNSDQVLKDYGNGNITLSAAGNQLYLGYVNTVGVRLHADLYGNDGTTLIADETGANLYEGGSTLASKYVQLDSGYGGPYLSSNYLIFQRAADTNIDYIAYNDSNNSFYFSADTALDNTSGNAGVYAGRFHGVSASDLLVGLGGDGNNYSAFDLRTRDTGTETFAINYIDADQISSGYKVRRHNSGTAFTDIFSIDNSGNVWAAGSISGNDLIAQGTGSTKIELSNDTVSIDADATIDIGSAGGFINFYGFTTHKDYAGNDRLIIDTQDADVWVQSKQDINFKVFNSKTWLDVNWIGDFSTGHIEMGFFGASPVAKPVVSNLGSLASGLAALGLIDDQSGGLAGFDIQTASDLTTRVGSGFFQTSSATVAEGWPLDDAWMYAMSMTHNNDTNYYSLQIAGDFDAQRFWMRNTASLGTQGWSELYHTNHKPTLAELGAAASSHNHTSLTDIDYLKFGPGVAANDDAHIEWVAPANDQGVLRISTSDAGTEAIEFGDYDNTGRGGAFTRWAEFTRAAITFDSAINSTKSLTVTGTGTIAGTNWDNGWLKIGNSSAGWAFDNNELYGAAASIIGTITGDIDLRPAGKVKLGSALMITDTTNNGIIDHDSDRVIDVNGTTLRIGEAGKHTVVRLHGTSTSSFKAYTGGNDYTIYHTGYKPSPADIGAFAVGDDINVNTIQLGNVEKTNLVTDGQFGFDSSQGLLVYRTQQGTTGTVSVLDGANVDAGTGINISNLGTGDTGTGAFVFSFDTSWGDSRYAAAGHNHSASDITSGTLNEARQATNSSPNRASNLSGTVNLDTVTTPGFYYESANADATSASNYPMGHAGSLMVLPSAGTTQLYFTYNGSSRAFMRNSYNGWSAWHEFAMSNSSNFQFAGSIGIGVTPASTFNNGAALALGDGDTGIRQNGDGIFEIWCNNQEVMQFDTTYARVVDNKNLCAGSGADLRLVHDGTNSHIRSMTGSLYVRGYAHGQGIFFQQEDSGGTNRAALYIQGNTPRVELFYGGAEKLETTSAGIYITGTWTASSDVRRKKNIRRNIDPKQLREKLMQIQWVVFDWKDNHDKNVLGVIAQEVQKILPDAVREESDGFLSVDYQYINNMWNVVNRWQEERLQQQEERLQKLEERLERLEAA